MADYDYPALARTRPAVEPCWMCGIHLPVSQMLADGGNACGNVRWYCLDVRACTERWTTRPARPDSGFGDGQGTSSARAAAGA
jgi:hypothetical protein